MKKHGLKFKFLFCVIAASLRLAGCDSNSGDGTDITNRVAGEYLERATIVHVVDGDTIDVDILSVGHSGHSLASPQTGERHRVRLIGIDAPEATGGNIQPFGPEATEYLRAILPAGSQVYLVRVPGAANDGNNTDTWGRLRRHVWTAVPTTNVSDMRAGHTGARMLLSGLAVVTGANLANMHRDTFLVFSGEAQSANRGLWAANP